MESGREAAQRVHEYITGLKDQHMSFYEKYYKENLYDTMLEGKAMKDLPPD
jgi:flavin-dependent dehydrogenase